MKSNETALILIGYQNDYFDKDGILHSIIEGQSDGVLKNTMKLIEDLPKDMLIVSTPIIFSEDYHELVNPIGILKTIQDVGAFKNNSKGSKNIKEIEEAGDRILEIKGKQSFNAFLNTKLDDILKENNIKNVLIAGAITSICIDSTGRAASEKGYKTTILSDCTCGKTFFEQEYYCDNIFPTYAIMKTTKDILKEME